MCKDQQKNSNECLDLSPEILANVNNIPVKLFLDSGCDMSSISLEMYDNNKDNSWKDFSVLPVNNIRMITASGKLTSNINKQVLLPINIAGKTIYSNFLIIPRLIKPIILGLDFLIKYEVKIDFENLEVRLCINNEEINVRFSEYTKKEAEQQIKFLYSQDKFKNFIDLIKENPFCQPVSNNNNNIKTINKCFQNCVELNVANKPYLANLVINSDLDKTNMTYNKIIKIVNDNNNLNEKQKEKLLDLLCKYIDIFKEKSGRCNCYKYELQVKTDKPILKRNYNVPFQLIEQVDQEIDRMIRENIIEETITEYISPHVIVKKKKGIRVCFDGRFLNQILKSDPITHESLEIMIQKCYQTKYFSTLDLSQAFWQIPLTDNSKKYTGFQYRNKVYQYTVNPYGLKTSLAALMRALQKVFNNETDKYSIIFVDDILCMSKSYEEHLTHLENIFSKLANANMTINLEKCNLIAKEVKFLGYILSEDGLKTDPEKIKAIVEYPSPRSQKNLKSFIGMCNYYNKFCERYAEFIAPLLPLTSKKSKWHWDNNNELQLNKIKEQFLNTVLLHHPITNKDYFLNTDASMLAIAGVLYQYDDEDNQRVIMFLSRTLKAAERNYSSFEQECLAVVWSLKKIKNYIIGSHITIITDNLALTHLNTCKLLNNRMTKWCLEMQQYNYTIMHCSGKKNIVADILSRNFKDKTLENKHTFKITYFSYKVDKEFAGLLKNIKGLQDEDEEIKAIIDNIKSRDEDNENIVDSISNRPVINPSENSNKIIMNNDSIYRLIDGILYKRSDDSYKILVPRILRVPLIKQSHYYFSHVGADKVIRLLRNHFIWKHMGREIRTVLAGCQLCQKCKYPNVTNYAPMKNIITSAPNELICIDYLGPLIKSRGNYEYILIIVDCFSKYVTVYPLRKATCYSTLKKLCEDYLIKYPSVKKILSDNATQFHSKKWYTTMKELNIEHSFTSIRHAQANPTERYIRSIIQLLRVYINENHSKWIDYLDFVVKAINNTENSSTNFTPNFLHHGIRDKFFWENYIEYKGKPDITGVSTDSSYKVCLEIAKNNIIRAGIKNKNYYDKKHRFTEFKIDDKVWVKNCNISSKLKGKIKKFFCLYNGPYIVKKIYNGCTYLIVNQHGKNMGKFPVSSLKKYTPEV